MQKQADGRTQKPRRGHRAAETAAQENGKALWLDFDSGPALTAFGLFCFILVASPWFLSGFWPTTYDYLPQGLFSGLLACTVLILALRPRYSDASTVSSRPTTLYGSLIAFFAWLFLSCLRSVYLHDSLLEISRVGTILTCFPVATAVLQSNAARVRIVLYAVLAGTLIAIAPVLYAYFVVHESGHPGTFYNYNLFANYCALALPLSLALLADAAMKPRRGRVALVVGLAVASALIGVAVLQSGSKGGLLATLCGCLVFAVAILKAVRAEVVAAVKARPAAVMLVAVLVMGGGGLVARKTVLPRIRAAMGSQANSTEFRAYTWRGTIRMANARPVLGFGAGAYDSAYPRYAYTGFTRSAHEVWLQLAAESGWPAMLLLVLACALGAWNSWGALKTESWPVAAGTLGAIVAFCVHGMTDAGWGITSIATLLVVVLAITDSGINALPDSGQLSREREIRPGLRYNCLLLSVVLASGAYIAERASDGERYREDSVEHLGHVQAWLESHGRPPVGSQDATHLAAELDNALESANLAVSSDPLSEPALLAVANARAANGLDAREAYRAVVGARPTAAQPWLFLAQYDETHDSSNAIEDYGAAMDRDPNDTSIRWARANYWFKRGDSLVSWRDIQHIADSLDRPYGLYPATPERVDLNYARAFLKLGERALSEGNKADARKYADRAAGIMALAHKYRADQVAMAQAVGDSSELAPPEKLDDLDAELKALKERAK